MPSSRQIQPGLRSLPAVYIAASFASGIGAAMLLDGRGDLWLPVVFILVGVSAAFIRRLRMPALLMVIAATGMADFYLSTLPTAIPEGVRCSYSGEITRMIETSARPSAIVSIDHLDGRSVKPFLARITIDTIDHRIDAGMNIAFDAELKPPSSLRSMPDEISPADILSDRKIEATAFVRGRDIVSVTQAGGLLAAMARWRIRLRDMIYGSALSPDSKTFLATALLGQRDALSSDTREAFAGAGLSHILALSGMHVAIVAAFIFWLLSPMVLIVPRHIRSVVLIAAVWGYAMLTGMGAPVVRASFMVSTVLLADILQRRTFAHNSLMAAALVILVFSPTQLSDIGFQLSFLAVASIISFADSLNPFEYSRHLILRGLGTALAMSIAAMMATSLVSALWFHSLPLLFLVANIIVGPVFVPVILAGGIIVIVALLAGLPYGIPCLIVDLSVDAVTSIASFIASLPHATVEIHALSPVTVALLLITLFVISRHISHRSSYIGLIASIALSVVTIASAFVTSPMKERDIAGTWYWLRSTDAADIVIPCGSSLYLVSDAPSSTLSARALTLSSRLKEYMSRRDIDSLTVMPDRFHSHGISRSSGHLVVGSTRISIIGPTHTIPDSVTFHPDILVIARGYHGDLAEVLARLCPSEVYLSPALNPRLAKRYRAIATDAIADSES